MNKKSLNAMTTGMVILLVLAICVGIYATLAAAGAGTDVATYVHALAYCLTGLFAIYYILAGCKKDGGAGYFVTFMYAFAVCCVLLMLRVKEMSVLGGILNCLTCGALCVLSMAKDLGQKKSKSLAGAVVVFAVIGLVAHLVAGDFAVAYPAAVFNLVFALNVLFMVTAKYYDKATRGSK